MTRRIPALAAIGILAGVSAGAVAAAVIPRTSGATAATPAAPAPGVVPASPTVRRVARPRREPSSLARVTLRVAGPVRIAARVADPRGGPDWAVRVFLADEIAPGASDFVGHRRCAQLGRLHDGHFGWLSSDGTFRPVGISRFGAPSRCVSRRPDIGGNPEGEVLTIITDPRAPEAAALQNVVWGLAGSAATTPRLRVGTTAIPVGSGPSGALLAVLAADADPAAVRLQVRYPARGVIQVLRGPQVPGFGRRFPGPARPRPNAAPQLAAQAPDPDGGLPYGMTATPTGDGQFCTVAGGRVIGGRVGSPDYALDTFLVGNFGGGQCPAPRAQQKHITLDGRPAPPFAMGTSFGGGLGAEPGDDPAAGRVARRTLRGRVVVSGTADADVASLTFASPSDVRTIAPSGPAHAFIIVYGGGFPTGDMVVTTRFRDGRTRRDSFQLSF